MKSKPKGTIMKKAILSFAAVIAIAASAYFVADKAGSTATTAHACSSTSHCE